MRNLLALGLTVLMVISLNSMAWASGGESHEGGPRNLFPKPQPTKSKATRPAKVTLLEPKALSVVQGTQVTLKWSESEGADSYRIQVATDPNFKWLIASEDFFKGTSYEVKGLEAGKHYFWRVYGVKSDNDPSYTAGFADFSSFETK